ncbi:MAG TPA: transglycosylase family protein [Acidimicrobiales bacterium]|nr:transglycosylase family protein [Acidimicrobiales bacterium]
MAPPEPRGWRARPSVVFLSVVLLASAVQQATAGGQSVEAKREEAARLTTAISEQAQRIVALDRRHRAAQERLADTQARLREAEAGIRAASDRQDAARRRMAASAIDAYVRGGPVTVLGKRLKATSDLAVYDTYLGLVVGLDRRDIEGLRGAREDLAARRAALETAEERARAESGRIAADRSALLAAKDAQQDILSRVNGELASLVAAEQARRARLAPAPLRAASVPVGAAPTRPASTAAPDPATGSTDPASDPFACIRQLESGNNYRTPGGGAYQFQDATWQSLGYTGSAQDAPPAVQDQAARELQARDGWKPWTTASACGLL